MKKSIPLLVITIITLFTLFFGVSREPESPVEVLSSRLPDTSDIFARSDSGVVLKDTIINYQILISQIVPDSQMKGKNVLITMGGMGAKLIWVQKWTEELYKSKLNEFNIGLIIVVKGPVEEYYDSREIDIKEMTKRFVAFYKKYGLNETFLIVHSSGVFPAHQMFDYLYLGGEDPMIKKMNIRKLEILDPEGITKNKINYIMLDGELGIPKGYPLVEGMVKNLKKVYSFYSIDAQTGTESGMAEEAKKVKDTFTAKTILHKHIAENSGCNPGAKWCVHETLITTRPHNPAGYDLEKDYQIFDSTRKVVTGYMDVVRNGNWE